ncbi:MAG: aminopeptidase, partial [Candidatus Wolframiiraptor sp. EX4484-121]
MADPRVSRLADLLTSYSVEVRDGDEVLITAGIEALPLIRELYKHVLIRGGNPFVVMTDDALDEIFYRYA